MAATLRDQLDEASSVQAVAMEVAVFNTHLAIASSAVLCDLLPVDELIDLVS